MSTRPELVARLCSPPKLTDRRFTMDAQSRRRERRAAKQAEWKADNPMSVGVRAKPVRTTLKLSNKSRTERAINPIDLNLLSEYLEQLEKRAESIERKNHKIWYRKPGERGITCNGKEKLKSGCIPLI